MDIVSCVLLFLLLFTLWKTNAVSFKLHCTKLTPGASNFYFGLFMKEQQQQCQVNLAVMIIYQLFSSFFVTASLVHTLYRGGQCNINRGLRNNITNINISCENKSQCWSCDGSDKAEACLAVVLQSFKKKKDLSLLSSSSYPFLLEGKKTIFLGFLQIIHFNGCSDFWFWKYRTF